MNPPITANSINNKKMQAIQAKIINLEETQVYDLRKLGSSFSVYDLIQTLIKEPVSMILFELFFHLSSIYKRI